MLGKNIKENIEGKNMKLSQVSKLDNCVLVSQRRSVFRFYIHDARPLNALKANLV